MPGSIDYYYHLQAILRKWLTKKTIPRTQQSSGSRTRCSTWADLDRSVSSPQTAMFSSSVQIGKRQIGLTIIYTGVVIHWSYYFNSTLGQLLRMCEPARQTICDSRRQENPRPSHPSHPGTVLQRRPWWDPAISHLHLSRAGIVSYQPEQAAHSQSEWRRPIPLTDETGQDGGM